MRFRLFSVAATLIPAALAALSCGGDTIVEPPPPTTVGSARISWRLVSNQGMPVSCNEIRIESAAVSIGRETEIVACGEEMSVVFADLLQQRYPVIVELRTLGSAVAYQTSGNVVVEGGKEATLELTFEIDLLNALSGSAEISWRIDDTPAAQGCSPVDGQTVRITELDGSIADVDVTAACAAGMHTIEMMQPGLYGLRLELIDSTGSRITLSSISSLEVKPGEVTQPTQVEFATMAVERATVYASWTVNGASTATAACAAVDADTVVVKAFPGNEMIATLTASAACDRGFIRAEDVLPGSGPHRVVFQLYTGLASVPPIPAILTSTTVYDVILRAGETSSVSANLRTM
jgi:hypothetical protein